MALIVALNISESKSSGLAFVIVLSSVLMIVRYLWRHAFNENGLRDTRSLIFMLISKN